MAHAHISLPKVTIVTTVFNAVNTIEDTIQSVLNQTYGNLEYIIVDGASTDGTLEIIERYRSRIALIISEPDKGIADGFNKGIAQATGEWIGMINADDWYALNAIELMMSAVTDADNICCGNLMLVTPKGDSRLKKSKVSWLNFGMYVMHPTCFVRSRVYKHAGLYDLSFKIAMDFDLFMRMKRLGYQIKYVDELIAFMRTGGASADVARMHKEEVLVMRRHLGLMAYVCSRMVKYLDVIRWAFFYRALTHSQPQNIR